jgi:predicted DNA-binding protein YlxM (UPF0122 family)
MTSVADHLTEIRRLRSDGLNMQEIAYIYGVSRERIRQILKAGNCVLPPYTHPHTVRPCTVCGVDIYPKLKGRCTAHPYKKEMLTLVCAVCEVAFQRSARYERRYEKRRVRKGQPTCSPKCRAWLVDMFNIRGER